MSRYDDSDHRPRKWTNAKLMREAKLKGARGPHIKFSGSWDCVFQADYEARRQSWYESWLGPILDEIERRFVKPKREKP